MNCVKNNFKIIIAFIIVFSLSCGEKIPIKEMSLARLSISRANSVKAQKYAPDEIEEAKKKLLECHDQIKADKLDQAKKSAIDSEKKAVDAYNKAVPLLASDTIKSAEDALTEAEESYAEALSESEYKNAENLLLEAKGMYDSQKFYDSYTKALESLSEANRSREIALGKKGLLEDGISEVKYTLSEAEKYNSQTHANSEIMTALENIEIVENSLQNLKLKEGFTALEIAKTNADDAYIISLKETTKEDISNAEVFYEDAVNSEGAEIAVDELDGAKESLALAKSNFSESNYKDAISASIESKRLSYIVINTKKVEIEEVKDVTIAKKEDVVKTKKQVEIEQDKHLKGTEDYYIYKVKYNPARRDCLWRIAERYYKKPLLWKSIYNANKDKIYNPDLIWPDMLLKIPIIKKNKEEAVIKKEDKAIIKEDEVIE
ncbi:MAG: LysM peptidoglycan-binding domain-containing protein [Spirochaetota bacterium]|nr:LysM peptidoglycan-binding domain-containing protein [Spirochaetota bacterium]